MFRIKIPTGGRGIKPDFLSMVNNFATDCSIKQKGLFHFYVNLTAGRWQNLISEIAVFVKIAGTLLFLVIFNLRNKSKASKCIE